LGASCKELNYFGRDNNRENNNTIQAGAAFCDILAAKRRALEMSGAIFCLKTPRAPGF